jgi:hypothetical protein
MLVVQALVTLHNLRIDHVTMHSELKYLIEAKVVRLKCWDFGGKTGPDAKGRVVHQQKTFPSGRNGCVRVDMLCQSRQRHPGAGLLLAQRQYYVPLWTSPSDRCFAVSSRSVSLLLYTNTLALW